jgi:hypothetical protein
MPGAKYHADGFQLLTNPADTAASLTVNASTAHRLWVFEINMGNIGTPADLTSVYLIGQVTAPGSAGTTVTATQMEDAADVVSRSVFISNVTTTEPTYVNTSTTQGLAVPADGDMLRVPLNHRATYRWVAPPGGEFVAPATTTDGFGGKADHASAVTEYMIGMSWIE